MQLPKVVFPRAVVLSLPDALTPALLAPSHKIILPLLRNCNFATVTNYVVNL